MRGRAAIESLVGLDALAASRERADRDRSGFYLGAGIRNEQVEGGFDGTSILTSSSLVAAVPKLSSGSGCEISVLMLGRSGGGAFTYAQVDHDAVWLGATGDATAQQFDVDGRVSFFANQAVQPHVILGLGFKRLELRDGAVTPSGGDDAVYRGISWDAGIGASVFVLSRLLLDVSAIHGSVTCNTIAAVDGSTITIKDGLGGEGWSLRAELLWKVGGW